MKLRPEMALVCFTEAFARDGEWLTGAAAGPDGTVFRPACEFKGIGPAADACKEVALSIPDKIICPDIVYASFVNVPSRYQASSNQVPQPCGREPIILVVVGTAHNATTALRFSGQWVSIMCRSSTLNQSSRAVL